MAANDEMIREHQSTWHGFVRLLTACVIATAAALGLMAIFLL